MPPCLPNPCLTLTTLAGLLSSGPAELLQLAAAQGQQSLAQAALSSAAAVIAAQHRFIAQANSTGGTDSLLVVYVAGAHMTPDRPPPVHDSLP